MLIKMLVVKPLFIITLLYVVGSTEKEQTSNIISLIYDFIDVQKCPTTITAFICWEKDVLVKFWKNVSEKYNSKVLDPKKSSLDYSQPEQFQLILLDFSCEGSKKILKEAGQLNLFKAPFRWLIWGEKLDLNLDDCYFGVDSRVFVIKSNNNKEFRIKSIYKYARTFTGWAENYITTWSNDQGFSYFNELSASSNRTNIMGETVTVSYVFTYSDSPNHVWDYRKIEQDAATKLNYILVHHLNTMINGTIKKIFQKTWGYRNGTSSQYLGMIGDLQRGLADIGATPAFFTEDRIAIVDYIALTTPTTIKFIFRAPPLSYVTNVFTLPFDTSVWQACFILIPIILAIVYTIVMWEWKDPTFRQKIIDKYRILRPNVFDIFLMEIGAITQQGTDEEPQSNAGRIATIFTFVALMFLYTAYSANIVALLQSTTESIRTVNDLLNSRIKLGVEDVVYARYYFENEREPMRRLIYEQKIAPKGQKPNFITAEEGVLKMRDDFYAFHIELDKAYKLVSKTFQESEKCGLRIIDFVNLLRPLQTVKKNSTYKEIFKVGYRKIQESGVQSREFRRIYTSKPICANKGSNFVSVGLVDCYAAFLIFGAGVLCSFILFMFEVMFMRYKVYRETHKVKLNEKLENAWKNDEGATTKIKSVEEMSIDDEYHLQYFD